MTLFRFIGNIGNVLILCFFPRNKIVRKFTKKKEEKIEKEEKEGEKDNEKGRGREGREEG